MDLDDDVPQFSSPEKSSPEPQKKFKRLKKRLSASPPARSIDADCAEEDAAAKTLNAILNEDDSIDAADEALDAILNEDDSIDAADKTLDAILNEDDSIDAVDKTLAAILNEDDSLDADADDDSNHAADVTLDAILNEDDDSNDAADKTLNAILNEDTNDSFPARLESLLDTDDSNGPAETLPLAGDRKVTKRALFSDEADYDIDGDSGRTEKKHVNEEGSEKEGGDKEDSGSKKKNKRIKSDEKKSKPPAADKRRQEKERKEHLKQLHAESQRLLRETTEAAFKPIPAVKKPISSVLEKIRQRKFELSKRKASLSGNGLVSESGVDLEDDMAGPDCRSKLTEPKKSRKTKPLEEVFSSYPKGLVGESVAEIDSLSEPAELWSNDEVLVEKKSPSEASVPMFRAPINDTEDIFANSETQVGIEELPGDLQDSPSVGAQEPSTLSMNLKLDSDPDEDSSSEEEVEDDKENMDPRLQRVGNDSTSLRGAPAEAYLDNEAEEDEDSDDESLGLNNNEEEEDIEDFEELNDIIATNYSEKSVDHVRRNELHQKWLEQQDAAGTDNLLQKFKISSTSNDDIEFVEEREVVSEDGEDYQQEDVELKLSARMTSKRAKEMIVQMFVDKKDDGFVSDEDEEIEKLRVKQELLIRAEEQATLISPMEDESSREMFGRIKKLNIAPENKKKAKPTSFFDSILNGGNSNSSSSKPSFVRQTSNQPLPSSRKKGSGPVKSFIFGREDSNSRSSISISEDSLDAVPKQNETTTTRTSTSMFSSSQAKFSSHYKSTATAKSSGASLFEILKRSSTAPSMKLDKDRVDLTTVLNTFKVPKKQIKVVGRS